MIKSFGVQRRLEIEIEDSGYALLDESWQCENECSPFSRLYYIKEGSGWLRHGDEITELVGGRVYLIPAEYEFSYGCVKLEKLYFHISVLTAEQYELLVGMNRICSEPFSLSEYAELYRCCFSGNYVDFLKLKTTIYETVANMVEKTEFSGSDIRRYSETVKKVMTYIQNNAKISLTANSVAAALFLSESRMRSIFRTETGVTVGRYIDDIVFTKAKKLLAKKQLPIEKITKELGFCDRFYFSRSFKKRTGKTPSQYRRESGPR